MNNIKESISPYSVNRNVMKRNEIMKVTGNKMGKQVVKWEWEVNTFTNTN